MHDLEDCRKNDLQNIRIKMGSGKARRHYGIVESGLNLGWEVLSSNLSFIMKLTVVSLGQVSLISASYALQDSCSFG